MARATNLTYPPRPGVRSVAFASVGIAVLAAAAAYLAATRRRPGPSNAEHPAPDLALDQPHPGPDHRAPDAFRPDPTAPVPASEREGLRPATGPVPTMVAG